MKRLLLLALGFTSVSALALPLAYDGFDYPLVSPAPLYTNLVGQSPDWVYAGNAASADRQPYINAGSLAYPPLAASQGSNSVAFGGLGSGAMAARLNLPSAVSSGTLYYSFIMKLTDITGISTSGIFWVGFNNSSGSQTTVPSIVGTRVDTRADADGYNIGLDKSSGGAANFKWYPDNTTPTKFNVGDVLFVVGSYTFNTGTTSDDVSEMWINPNGADFAITTPPPAPLTNTAGNDLNGNQIGSFCIFNRSSAEPQGIVIDDVRVGTTWADVTPTANSMAIITQPKDVRIVAGANAAFTVKGYLTTTYQWQHNGVDIAGATTTSLTISNAQLSDAGSYHVIVGNGVATPLTSSNAVLTVKADTFPRLSPLWSIAPFSRPYLTTDASQNPMQRYFAYNVLSNQVLIVSRTNIDTLASTGMVYVLNATSGADLYQMNADSSIISGGLNGVTLNSVDVADDGAVYGANISDLPSGTMFSLYRWENSDSNTPPVNMFTGFPFGGGSERYGDSLAVRGSNVTTQVLLDDSRGLYGDIMGPTDSSMTTFLPYLPYGGQFTNVIGGLTGGRTVLFADANAYGPTAFWEHHRGGNLNLASYDLNTVSSAIITNYPLPSTMGVCGFNFSLNLLCGINFLDNTNSPDTLDLYDMSDPSLPVYIASYNFPTNSQPNANRCGRVIFSGDKVWALDANNGFLAFQVVPKLTISSSGADVLLSWPTNFSGFTLTASPSLSAPVNFTNVSTGTIVGNQYVVTNTASSASLFYRLKQ